MFNVINMATNQLERTDAIGDVDININRMLKPTPGTWPKATKPNKEKTKEEVCINCGYQAQPNDTTKEKCEHVNKESGFPTLYCYVSTGSSKNAFGYCACTNSTA